MCVIKLLFFTSFLDSTFSSGLVKSFTRSV
uniref:Uncharacterized protein n=1 Tax=Anguilla anguilla TaxID=7936 RepID=A0A0E9TYC9_ANGAN